MPLTRANLTIASCVMLPLYPAFSFGVGLAFVATPRARLLTSPALRTVDHLFPLGLWGWAFLALAAWLGGALLARSRAAVVRGLAVMVAWMLLYSAVMAWSAIDGGASFSAWTWPMFVGVACFASTLSLMARES